METGIIFKSAKTTASRLASRTCQCILLISLVCFVALHPAKAFPPGAIICQGDIDFNGRNITVDSFDSTDPDHSSWPDYPAGRGYGVYTNTGATANPYRKANGNVATTSRIIGSASIGDGIIFGKVSVGPGGSISLGLRGSVGDLSWVPTFGVQPGCITDDMTAVFNPIAAPDTNWISLPNNTSITNSGCYTMDMINGNMLIGGSNTITVTLLLTNGIFLSSPKSLMIASNAWVTLYAGNQINDGGGSILNTSRHAPQFAVYGLPTLTSIKLNGNGAFWGLVYAPSAMLQIKGYGASGGYYGAFVCSNIVCIGSTTFSFDESLIPILEPLLAGSSLDASFDGANHQLKVTVSGYPGRQYVVQSSTNLTDWISTSTNTSPFVYTNSAAPSFFQLFYRAVTH